MPPCGTFAYEVKVPVHDEQAGRAWAGGVRRVVPVSGRELHDDRLVGLAPTFSVGNGDTILDGWRPSVPISNMPRSKITLTASARERSRIRAVSFHIATALVESQAGRNVRRYPEAATVRWPPRSQQPCCFATVRSRSRAGDSARNSSNVTERRVVEAGAPRLTRGGRVSCGWGSRSCRRSRRRQPSPGAAGRPNICFALVPADMALGPRHPSRHAISCAARPRRCSAVPGLVDPRTRALPAAADRRPGRAVPVALASSSPTSDPFGLRQEVEREAFVA